MRTALYPDPTQKGKGLVTIERFLGCAESALCHISYDLGMSALTVDKVDHIVRGQPFS